MISPTFPSGHFGCFSCFTNLRSPEFSSDSGLTMPVLVMADGFLFAMPRAWSFRVGGQHLRTQRTSRIDFDSVKTIPQKSIMSHTNVGAAFGFPMISSANKVLGDVGGALSFNQGPGRIHCEMSCWMLARASCLTCQRTMSLVACGDQCQCQIRNREPCRRWTVSLTTFNMRM